MDTLYQGAKSVVTAAFNLSVNTDDARSYVMYLMFDGLHSLVLNCDLYLKKGEMV